jgi:4-hydroxybenzoate polyprenyltransferase
VKKLLGFARLTRPYVTLSTSFLFVGSTFLSVEGIPPVWPFAAGYLAVVLATAAIHTFNDYSDWRNDAKNPRTSKRPIPTGLISPNEALFAAVAYGLFALALALLLNTYSFLIALVSVPIIFVYAYFKKHSIPFGFICPVMAVVLLVLFGCAAVTGKMIAGQVWLLLVVSLLWEPGRDLISEIQDVALDKDSGFLTLPVILSPKGAAKCVLALFAMTSNAAVLAGIHAGLGVLYLIIALLTGGWLIYRTAGIVKEPTTKNAVKMRIRAPRYLMAIVIAIVISNIICGGAP